MPPTKDYLINQVKTGNVVHFLGKRCTTVAEVEALFAEADKSEPAAGKKPSASKLPPAKKDAE